MYIIERVCKFKSGCRKNSSQSNIFAGSNVSRVLRLQYKAYRVKDLLCLLSARQAEYIYSFSLENIGFSFQGPKNAL